MSRFGNIHIPPLKAAVNVAWQTVRQQIPDKISSTQKQAEKVHFAQTNHTGGHGSEHHELSNMNTKISWSPTDQLSQAEDSFNQGYQTGGTGMGKQQSFASMDLSEDDFVEGRSAVKINEYQAAWNVTNAIQVYNILL